MGNTGIWQPNVNNQPIGKLLILMTWLFKSCQKLGLWPFIENILSMASKLTLRYSDIYKLLINEQPKISTSNTVSISHLFKHLLLTKWIKFFPLFNSWMFSLLSIHLTMALFGQHGSMNGNPFAIIYTCNTPYSNTFPVYTAL